MTEIEHPALPQATVSQSGHEGSASLQLAGWTVVLTWGASILTHVGLFALMFSAPWLTVWSVEEPAAQARAELVGDPDAPRWSDAPIPDLSSAAAVTDRTEIQYTPRRSDVLSDLPHMQRPELSVIGIGVGGGDFSKLGLTVGSGSGPDFFGLGRSARGARRIVFVVDRSGSMAGTFELVRDELKRSVSALRRNQKFHVIFFSEGAVENPPRRLVGAIKEQRDKLFAFVDDIMPQGGTHPETAMRRAFAVEPDLIYFLTDGQFDDSLLVKLARWNKQRRVRIFTIAYFNPEGAELLEQIAREHDGEFKYVTDDDIP
ncbi:MAG: VWA domain-containing protein [Phycisphaerae bacterium]